MVSMKDLAAACNVSIATVSKALNDQHDVSAKTKEMVRKKAKELGYFPNSAAKALKTCPKCGNIMKKRSGIYGEFWGCSGYPDCRYTEDC